MAIRSSRHDAHAKMVVAAAGVVLCQQLASRHDIPMEAVCEVSATQCCEMAKLDDHWLGV